MGDSKWSYPNNPDAYGIIEKIGEGSFAKVYKADVVAEDDKKHIVAIKIMDLLAPQNDWQILYNEIMIMCRIKHPNLVQIMCSFVVDNELWVVMPIHRQSCKSVLKELKKGL